MNTSPFVYVEWGHPKDRNDPANQSDDDNTNHHRHTSPTYRREDLAAQDTAQCAITDHENDVENCYELGRPVPHEVPCNDLRPYKRLYLAILLKTALTIVLLPL